MVKDEEQWSQNDQEDHWTKAVMSHRELLRGIRGLKMSIPKLCNVCRISSSVMYCKAHDAQLCRGCDSKIHGGGASCHEREWLCDVCEQAPAVVTCKADAASLCVACDNDIHSANPLAGRHERIPLSPFHGFPQEPNNNLECSSFLNDDGGGDNELDDAGNGTPHTLSHSDGADEHRYPEESAVPWLISEPPSKQNLISADDDRSTVKDKLKFKAYLQSIDFFQDVESYVDLEYLNTTTASSAPILASSAASVCINMGADSMVPVHTPEVYDHSSKASNDSAGSLDLDAYKSNYAFRAASLTHCVSSSSMDVGVVPESATTNDLTSPFSDPKAFQIHQNNISQMGEQPELMGREAKVLRYREKRKNRKFEKTIRYASRKAYAETRPRIKGRFAKRTDAEVEQLYSSSLVSDQGYDVVSSF